jgi:serine/threonine protein kinase
MPQPEPQSFTDTFAPGRLLAGRFELGEPHRQGGLSVAFEALDRQSGEPCEVQFFSAGLFEGEKEARGFAESLAGWVRLDDPRVLRVRAIVVEGPCAFVATDLPRGRSLRTELDQHLAKGPSGLPEERVLAIGVELARALEAIHGAGLVHGDLKPSAVFIDKGSCVLADGGSTPALWSAKHLGERTALIGTPYYAPIEQFGGEAPSASSDVYNLATVLFELATGVQPWAGRTFLEVFQSKLASEPPTFASRAPHARGLEALERAIRRGLSPDTKRRYPSASALRSALENLD